MINNNKLARITLISVTALLFVGSIIFVLEKAHVINMYSKPQQVVTTTETRPVNDVRYTPATSAEQKEGDQIKQNLINESNNPPAQATKITISLSAATQDIVGGPLVVRSIVSATSGTCKLTLSQGTIKKEYTNQVTNLGTYNSCNGFDIPATDLNPGKWKLNLSINNGQEYGEISQDVNITK